jgi:hypothetical protein
LQRADDRSRAHFGLAPRDVFIEVLYTRDGWVIAEVGGCYEVWNEFKLRTDEMPERAGATWKGEKVCGKHLLVLDAWKDMLSRAA